MHLLSLYSSISMAPKIAYICAGSPLIVGEGHINLSTGGKKAWHLWLPYPGLSGSNNSRMRSARLAHHRTTSHGENSFDENSVWSMIACLVRLGPHPMPLSDPRSRVMMFHDPISGASICVSIIFTFSSRSLFTLDFCIFRSSIPLRLASMKLYPRPFASLLDVRFRTVEPCGPIALSLISSFDT